MPGFILRPDLKHPVDMSELTLLTESLNYAQKNAEKLLKKSFPDDELSSNMRSNLEQILAHSNKGLQNIIWYLAPDHKPVYLKNVVTELNQVTQILNSRETFLEQNPKQEAVDYFSPERDMQDFIRIWDYHQSNLVEESEVVKVEDKVKRGEEISTQTDAAVDKKIEDPDVFSPKGPG